MLSMRDFKGKREKNLITIKQKMLLRIFLLMTFVLICVYSLYVRTCKRVVITIANSYSYEYFPEDYLPGNVVIYQIYSDGSGCSYSGYRVSDSLKDKSFLEYSTLSRKVRFKGKIPQDELEILLSLYYDLQRYEDLYTETRSHDVDTWVLCNSIEYQVALADMPFSMPEGTEELKEKGYELNDWIIKFDEFLERFYFKSASYWDEEN